MSIHLSWSEIALRLACTILAGAIVGINRDEKGRAAGMRTNILVCLAASVSMILTNAMLGLSGKTSSSFAVMDLMRLPLGILSGMGFIGAGVILRKGEMVLGVTTAATLWVITVLGLCFGGGYILLGFAGLILVMLTLMGFKFIEHLLPQEQRASLYIESIGDDETSREVRALAQHHGMHIHSWSRDTSRNNTRVRLTCDLRWRSRDHEAAEPAWIEALRYRANIERVRWQS